MTSQRASTTPGLSDAASAVLVVIDIQERLCGAMPGKVLNRVVQNTRMLLGAANRLGLPVIHTEQYPRGLGGTDPRILEVLPSGAVAIEKTRFSCAEVTEFEARIAALPDRRELIFTGMEAHVCVLQSAFDFSARGYTVRVVEDAICSRRLEDYQNALNRLRCHGVDVVTSESVAFEWLRDARHPEFKPISQLLRS